jgi:Ras-related GTP-binding protein A/B
MRSVIFENYLPRDVIRLKLSVGIDNNRIRLLNNLHLNLWDCGGQKEYVANYLNKQKEYIFRNVYVLLFVFDIFSLSVTNDPNASPADRKESQDLKAFANTLADSSALHQGSDGKLHQQNNNDWTKQEMLDYFASGILYLREQSPNARVTVLLHKIDIISPEYRERIIAMRKQEIIQRLHNCGVPESATSMIDFFATTIWSDSLYFAYSTIVRSLVPNRGILINELKRIHKACDAADVALFERGTLLTIAHVSGDGAEVDATDSEGRTSAIADIMKGFRMSCMQSGTTPQQLKLTLGGGGTALLTPFTECTLVLVVSHDARTSVEMHQLNVEAVRSNFLTYLKSRDPVAVAMNEIL